MIRRFFLRFLLTYSNKNSGAPIKKLVKILMEFFRKFAILTENPINFDVTCSVILGTVGGRDQKIAIFAYFQY